MNAMSGTFRPAPQAGGVMPVSRQVELELAAASALGMKWAALHDAARVVAMLAGLETDPPGPEERDFAAMMHRVGGPRLVHAEQQVEDLSAIMEIGLKALLAVSARAGNPATAALALWQEFDSARAALLALAPPSAPAIARLSS
jgi:hypothetical protein